MRRVAQLNRDYLAIAIVIILLLVSLVFIVQLSRLRQTELALSGSLSIETTGEEPARVSPMEPGDMRPEGGPEQPKPLQTAITLRIVLMHR